MKAQHVLESTLAGAWYPETESEIRELAAEWEKAPVSSNSAAAAQRPNILILPHAGWAYSGLSAWRAVRQVRGMKFDRVVVIAPSHRAWIENRLVAPEAEAVSTPLGAIPVDRDWIDRLALMAPVVRNNRVHMAEHAAQIEFPLLQLALGDGFSIVPLVMGSFGADQMAMCARAFAGLMDERTLLVVSSDFTHYGEDFGYAPYGTSGGEDVRRKVAAVDEEVFAHVSKCDADGFASFIRKSGATICGHIPIELMLRAAGGNAKFMRLDYATSADEDRDFSRFVCYTAAAGRVEWPGEHHGTLDAETRTYLLRIARESMERAVRGSGRLKPLRADVPPAALARMGAFVTLNDRVTGALRGCIGEIMPMRPLVDAVVARAVDSALHDPRFMPVTERELGGIRVEVSALTQPRPIASWRDIVLGRDGMTLEKDGAFAVFLPQVAPEQGWDLVTTLSHLAQKAGLEADAWRDGAKFETFQAEVFHE